MTKGAALQSFFDSIMTSYAASSVPENATFNTTELNALKTFANTDNNESILDWLDDDGNIDTEKLQNNILFEYDGSNYRVVAIDVSDDEYVTLPVPRSPFTESVNLSPSAV